ncbi:MAG: FecR domain-containing protein [Candidatus Omnitrophota bacterium]
MRHEIDFGSLCDYLDKRLPDAFRKKVESHLAGCKSCREVFRLLENSDLAMRHLDEAKASPSFDREFNRKLYERLKRKEEKRVGFIINDILGKVKSAILSPPLTVVRVAISILLILFAHGVLKNSLVESPSVVSVKGNASVYIARQKMWLTTLDGVKLRKGDIINVKEDSFVDIRHQGKYSIRIKEDSEITVVKLLPKYISGTVLYSVAKGKALIYISDAFKGSKLIIKTPEAMATALGTEFLVDVSTGPIDMTRFGVLEGKVMVKSLFKPKERLRSRDVLVDGGEATEIYRGEVPITPRRLLEWEWEEMIEFYQIGKKTQVSLLISNGKHRTRELLKPCPIYIFGLEPPMAKEKLNNTIGLIDRAIKTNDRVRHLEGISRLETILTEYPNPLYEPQIRLFVGTYYNYLEMPEKAIEAFKLVHSRYRDSTFASMAIYAIGIVYSEKLNNENEANEYYGLVLKDYPQSPEASLLRELRKQ